MAISITTTSTNPLSGTNSLLIQKTGGVNDQGKGVSTEFSVDLAYRAKVLNISFDYIVNSGTFTAGSNSTDSDLIVYLYDITNSRLIEPSSFKLLSNSNTVSDTFKASFQTSYNASQYRLIFHQATTTTNNYELKIDNVSVSPTNLALGTPITDWQSYTPNITSGAGTISSNRFGRWRRVGDTAEILISYEYVSGTGASANFQLSVPSGLTVDLLKMIGGANVIGSGYIYTNAGGFINLTPRMASSAEIYFGKNAAYANLQGTDADEAGTFISTKIAVPIQGWSSSVQVSDGYDGRLITFVGNVPSAQALTANVTNIILSVAKDSTASWTGSTYIVPSSGDYEIAATVVNSVTAGTLMVYVDGVFQKTLFTISTSVWLSGSVIIPNLRAGQVVSFRQDTNVTISGGSSNTFSITKLASPQTMSATEVVAVRANNSSGQSIASGSSVTLTGWTKLEDTHNAFNASTGIFTAPETGYYSVEYSGLFASQGWSASGTNLYTNLSNPSTNIATYVRIAPSYTAPVPIQVGHNAIKLNAGQTVSINLNHDNGSARALDTGASFQNLSIIKVK